MTDKGQGHVELNGKRQPIWLPLSEEWKDRKWPNWGAHVAWGLAVVWGGHSEFGIAVGWMMSGMVLFGVMWEVALAVRRTGPRARVIDLTTWLVGAMVAGLASLIHAGVQ